MTWIRSLTFLMLAPLLFSMAGCGSRPDSWQKNRPKVYKASGTVTMDGKPVTEATVMFHSDTQTAQGRTDANGKFVLTTFEDGDGAVAGQQKVTISKVENYYVKTKYDSPTDPSKVLKQKELLPVQYTRVDKTPLTFTISESGPNDTTFEIKP